MPLAEAMHVFSVNFFSTYTASQTALPYLRLAWNDYQHEFDDRRAGSKELGSLCRQQRRPAELHQSARVEVAADGIRVNAVLPSNVDTPLMRAWAGTLADPQSALDRMAALPAAGSHGEAARDRSRLSYSGQR